MTAYFTPLSGVNFYAEEWPDGARDRRAVGDGVLWAEVDSAATYTKVPQVTTMPRCNHLSFTLNFLHHEYS